MNLHLSTRIALPATALSLFFCACGARQPDPARLAEVKSEVLSFAHAVAEKVTADGPAAWQNYFENSPAFFMAVDGRLQFADGASSRAAIPDLVRAIRKIELQWGDALRVDPLTQDFAVVAAPWHEVITLADGSRTEASGYFTAVAENRDGHWQFRDAHWSMAQPAGTASEAKP